MNYNLGRVLPIFKGEYDNDELYTNLDVVYYNGSSYVAKGETQGNLPTDNNNWQPVAMAGVLDPEQIADIEQQVIEYVQGQGYVIDPNYTHTDNNYTNADKTKLDGIDMSTKQDTLVSGTNIKTINNENILGSGNITIEGVSDYNDLNNKPSINGTTLTGNVNLATPSDLANKQDTLVSGTNIKTINNESLLGSGNITIEGEPAVNPFKGWFDNLTSLQTITPVIGDYGYVKGATTTDPVKIYECTTNGSWSDSGREVDTSSVQSFGSGQQVNSVKIKDENGEEISGNADVLSAEAGKELFEIDKEFDFVPVEDSALSTSSTWQFGSGTSNTFSGDGLNGTFTVVTGGSQTRAQRPYIVISNVVTGHYYRLKCHIINNSNTAFKGFALGSLQASVWLLLTDVYGKDTKSIPANGAGDVDAIFAGDAANNYLLMSFDNYASNDTLEMSDFSLTEVYSLNDAQRDVAKLKENTSGLADMSAFKAEAETGRTNTWPKVFGISDAAYKARLNATGSEDAAGTRYVYIFEVTDYVDVRAYLMDSNYLMYISVFDTLNGALKKTSAEKHNFGNGVYGQNNTLRTNYKDGRTSVRSGWLLLEVTKTDSSAITDADITAFEQKLSLEIKPAIESQIDSINERIDVDTKKNLTKDDCYLYVSDSNGCITTSSNTRVKFIKDRIIGGDKTISVDITSALESFPGLGYGVVVYANVINAKSATGTGNVNVLSAWKTQNLSAPINNTGVLGVFFRKNSSNASFTPEEVETLMAGVTINVNYVEDEQQGTDNYSDYDELPVGSFTLVTNNTIARASSVVLVPYLGVRYEVEMPEGWQASVKYGQTYTVGETSNWVSNDGSIEIPRGTNDDNLCQKLQIRKSNGAAITLNDVAAIIDNVHIRYKRLDGTIMERNSQSEQYVKAAMTRLHYTSDNIRVVGGLHSMPVITHVSDLHGDMKRFENAVDFSKYIGADAIIATGDTTLLYASDGVSYLKDVIDNKPIKLITTIGNHEVDVNGGTQLDNQQIFNKYISPFVQQGDYKKDANNAADNAYYFVDIDAYNLRIIVLNQFNSGYGGAYGIKGSLGQEQITWLCNTLIGTPANYGVIVAMHAQEEKASTPSTMSAWNQTITWSGGNDDTGLYANGIKSSSVEPIRQIIDAFISKTSLSLSYTEGYSNLSISIDVDFSSVASGVEFICYMCGHRHTDNIGYIDNAVNPQLVLNIASSNCHYQRYVALAFATEEDIPRGDRGVTQDAFNVYAIDRINKVVKIARVGSGVNFEGIERRFLIASYTTIPSNS